MTSSPHLDARIQFTPASNSSGPNSSNPPVIKINGRTFRVDYVRMQVNDKSYDVTLSQQELVAIASQCRDIYEKVIKSGDSAKTIEFTFEKQSHSESLSGMTLGKIFDRFKATPPPLELKSIEYRTAENSKPKVIELKDEDKAQVASEVQSIDQLTLKFFNDREQYWKPIPKKLTSEQTGLKKLIQNCIQEAGSEGHRCAALSIAKRELDLAKGQFKAITDKYELNEDLIGKLAAAKDDKDRMTVLSEALVQKAADIIGSQDEQTNPFLNTANTLQRAPCFAAIKTALEAHQTAEKKAQRDYIIPANPKSAVAAYAELIRKPGTMLDLPFFLALGVPFVIIRNDQNNNLFISESSENFVISGTIDSYNLDDANILFYNGTDHFQAVILKDKTDKDEMRQLLRQMVEGHMKTFVDDIGKDDLKAEHIKIYSSSFEDLTRLYPKAREEIIQKLIDRYQFIEETESLKDIAPKDFTAALIRRLGKSIS